MSLAYHVIGYSLETVGTPYGAMKFIILKLDRNFVFNESITVSTPNRIYPFNYISALISDTGVSPFPNQANAYVIEGEITTHSLYKEGTIIRWKHGPYYDSIANANTAGTAGFFYVFQDPNGDYYINVLRSIDSRYVYSAITSSSFGVISAPQLDFSVSFGATGWGELTTRDSTDFIHALLGDIPVPDPYYQHDTYPGGGSGTGDFLSSDNINFPSVPQLSAVDSGFVSLWCPTEDQLIKLSNYMWNSDFLTLDFWKNLVANPLDLIYGLSIVPLDLHSQSFSVIDTAQNVVVGLVDTGITVDHLTTQWIELDCGSLSIDEAWGAYLDYDPFTKLEICLPYCGTHPLKIDDFMPGTIHLKYFIDLLSGACIAVIKSTKSGSHGDTLNSVMYQFIGNCAAQIPVTSSQYADAVRSVISMAASIGSMVATGFAGGAAAAGARTYSAQDAIKARTMSSEISTGASAVENVMGMKPSIEKSGALGSTAGLMGVQTPYIVITRPRQAHPKDQNAYTGYPSFITSKLTDLTGWTIVQAIHLDNIPCTADELNEIDSLLKSGVIF